MSITVEANSDAFGWSVSISDDGTMTAVGAPNSGINGKGSGHVRIYLLDDNRINWKQIGGDIDGDMSGDRLGHSVSLSANGTIVVIGAPHAHVNEKIRSGEVKVYQLDSAGSNWERLGKSIFGENDSDMFGWSVDISSDGNTIAIGSRGYNSSTGSVRVFYLEVSDKGDQQWKPIGQNITGDAKGDKFVFPSLMMAKLSRLAPLFIMGEIWKIQVTSVSIKWMILKRIECRMAKTSMEKNLLESQDL